MKKIIIAVLVIALAGCKPVDRVNPTDPAAENYGGWTYLGEIGSFDELSDFIMYLPVPGDASQDSIIAVDRAGQEVSKYNVTGAPDWTVTTANIPEMVLPAGICELNGYCYILDKLHIEAFQIVTSGTATYWSDASVKGDKILARGGLLYAVVSDPPGVSIYTSDVIYPQSYSNTDIWGIVKGDASCNTCMSYIAGIAPGAGGEIMLMDGELDRISVYSESGVHLRNMDIGSDVIDAALYGSTLYVPTTDGIRMYNYSDGTFLTTIANYGDGNGKVMKPGPIELYGTRHIFVGSGSSIKYFETAGL